MQTYVKYICLYGFRHPNGFISVPYLDRGLKFMYQSRYILLKSDIFKHLDVRYSGQLKSVISSERTSNVRLEVINGVMKKVACDNSYGYLKSPASVIKLMLRANINMLNKSNIVTVSERHLSPIDKKMLFIEINIDFICYVFGIWSTYYPVDFKECLISYIEPVKREQWSATDLASYLNILLKKEPSFHTQKAMVINHWFATRAKSRGVAIVPYGFFDKLASAPHIEQGFYLLYNARNSLMKHEMVKYLERRDGPLMKHFLNDFAHKRSEHAKNYRDPTYAVKLLLRCNRNLIKKSIIYDAQGRRYSDFQLVLLFLEINIHFIFNVFNHWFSYYNESYTHYFESYGNIRKYRGESAEYIFGIKMEANTSDNKLIGCKPQVFNQWLV